MSGCIETRIEDRIGHLRLNRPEVMNAVNIELAQALAAALRSLAANDAVNVIAIRGAGGHFCAGGDFLEVQRLRALGPAALRVLFESFRHALAAIALVDVPVVAVVEGNAMAGGFELIQAVDFAIVHEDARLSDNHVNFAQVPGGGGSQRLPRIVGRQRALAHLLTGERIDGRRAAELGLVHRAFPASDFEASVEGFLAAIAGKNRTTLTKIKRLVLDGLDHPLEGGLDLELAAVVEHITGESGGQAYEAFTSTTKENAR